MHLALNIFEFTTWQDERLRYDDNPNVNNYLKTSRLDFTNWRYQIWRPNIAYTEENRAVNKSEICYLYPNGTVVFFR